MNDAARQDDNVDTRNDGSIGAASGDDVTAMQGRTVAADEAAGEMEEESSSAA